MTRRTQQVIQEALEELFRLYSMYLRPVAYPYEKPLYDWFSVTLDIQESTAVAALKALESASIQGVRWSPSRSRAFPRWLGRIRVQVTDPHYLDALKATGMKINLATLQVLHHTKADIELLRP